MVATRYTQSLSDFRQKAAETLDRLNKTSQAEIITVNGQARAVLLSPAAYDQLAHDALLAHDVITIRNAMKQIDDGLGVEVDDAFRSVRSNLLAMKKSKRSKASKS